MLVITVCAVGNEDDDAERCRHSGRRPVADGEDVVIPDMLLTYHTNISVIITNMLL